MRSLLGKGAASFALKVVALLLNSAAVVFLARVLGPSEFGKYAFLMALVTVCAIPTKLGMPQWIVRETSRSESPSYISGVWVWSHFVALVMSVVVIAAIYLFSDQLLRSSPVSEPHILPFSLVLLLALVGISGACLRGLGKVLVGQLPELVLRPGGFLVICFLFFYTLGWSPDYMSATTAQVFACLSAYVTAMVILLYSFPSRFWTSKIEFPTRRAIGVVFVFGLTAGAQLMSSNVDILMIGYIKDAELVATYRSSTMVAKVVGFALQGLNVIILPVLALSLFEARYHYAGAVARKVAMLSLTYSLICLGVILLTGQMAIDLLFGVGYEGVFKTLIILTVAQVVNSLFGPVGALLNMGGGERLALYGVVTGLCVNVLLNFLLIPSYGAVGAASALLVSTFVWNIMLWWSVKSRFGIDTLGYLRPPFAR